MRLLAKSVTSLDAADGSRRAELSKQFALLVEGSEPIGSLWSADERGNSLVDHSTPFPSSPSVADRPYFLANQAGQDVYIGERGIGTLSKRPRFIVSLRLEDGDGRFRGVLVAGMNASHFEDIYRLSRRSNGVDAVMVRSDGAILASWPSDDVFEVDHTWLPGADAGPWYSDEGHQVFSIHRVAEFPVYVVARLDLTQAIAEWQRRAGLALLLFAVAVGSFGLLVRRGLKLTAEMEDARRDLERRVNQRTAELRVLYDELNHRVKNNLQLVSALVRIGGNGIADPHAALALKQTSQRIDALADVHRLLEDTAGDVRMAPFVSRLLERLRDSFSSPDQKIETVLDVPNDLALASGDAVALGIALNEIVTNAFKHAFAGRSAGTIAVHYTSCDGHHSFAVSDDGIGIRPVARASTGSRVTEAMIAKLAGQVVTATRDGGTVVKISFPAAQRPS